MMSTLIDFAAGIREKMLVLQQLEAASRGLQQEHVAGGNRDPG